MVMYDHDNKRPRGFGFITFTSEEAVDAVFTGGTMQTLHDKPIEIKRAVPRDQMGPQSRPAIGGRGPHFPQAARSLGSSRQLGLAGPSAGMSPTSLANRGFGGLGLGLNGQLSAQDLQRASSDILTQMTALSLAGNSSIGLANLAQNISQGLAAQALGGTGSLGSTHLGLGQHGMLLGNQGQSQQNSLGSSALSAQIGRMSLSNNFSLGPQRNSVSSVSPTASNMRHNGLEEAFQSAFAMSPSAPDQHQQQHHLHSPGHGASFGSGQGFREDAAGLGSSMRTISRDLSGAFSGSFHHSQQHDAPLSTEHQWSLSSV